MMTFSVQYTSSAVEDLDDIFSYYRYGLGLDQFSLDFFDSLVESLNNLKANPEKYPCCGSEEWKARDLRSMPIEGAEVFYIPDPAEAIISIIRILFPKSFLTETKS